MIPQKADKEAGKVNSPDKAGKAEDKDEVCVFKRHGVGTQNARIHFYFFQTSELNKRR